MLNANINVEVFSVRVTVADGIGLTPGQLVCGIVSGPRTTIRVHAHIMSSPVQSSPVHRVGLSTAPKKQLGVNIYSLSCPPREAARPSNAIHWSLTPATLLFSPTNCAQKLSIEWMVLRVAARRSEARVGACCDRPDEGIERWRVSLEMYLPIGTYLP